jgi:hypothetical protein
VTSPALPRALWCRGAVSAARERGRSMRMGGREGESGGAWEQEARRKAGGRAQA